MNPPPPRMAYVYKVFQGFRARKPEFPLFHVSARAESGNHGILLVLEGVYVTFQNKDSHEPAAFADGIRVQRFQCFSEHGNLRFYLCAHAKPRYSIGFRRFFHDMPNTRFAAAGAGASRGGRES